MNSIAAIVVFALFVLGWMGTAFGFAAFRRLRGLYAAVVAANRTLAATLADYKDRVSHLEKTLEDARTNRAKAVALEGAKFPPAAVR